MDFRTPEEQAEFRERAERSSYIVNMTKNRQNRLEQYQRIVGRELTLAEIKRRFGGSKR